MTGTPPEGRCTWAEQHLAPYLLGQATPEERVAAARHLRDCPVCTAAAAELGPTAEALSLADPELVLPSLSPARRDALLQRTLAATAGATVPAHPVRRRPLLLAAAAAAVVVLAATLADAGSATRVVIEVSGLPAGLRYRAWVERCDGSREPLSEPFEPPADGRASVSATADLDPRTTAAVGVTGSDRRDVGRADLPRSCS